MPTVDVLDSTIHYRESGSGTPTVLLHGNPASSHIWRNVMPGLDQGRLLAPDLIGMGASGKPALDYTFADHARYLDAWFDALGLDRVILVGHDWGAALAFDWAARHPERVLGIAFLEAVVKPVAWEDLSPQARERTRLVRGADAEEALLGEENPLVRMAFTGGGVRTPVADEDLAAYLAPYPDRDSRRPLLTWARQLPIGGEPAEVVARIERFDTWLAASPDVPKLLMTFEGGGSLSTDARTVAWCRSHIAALEVTPCGPAAHHAPEDRPTHISAALTTWTTRHAFHPART